MHMTIRIHALAFSTAILAFPHVAAADSASVTQTGAFIAVQGGKSHFDIDRSVYAGSHSSSEDDSGKMFGVLGGYRWVVARPFSFGVEAGYARLGDTRWEQVAGGLSLRHHTRESTTSDALLLGINGKWDLPFDLTATARLGVANVRTRYKGSDNSYYVFQSEVLSPYHQSSRSTGLYGGVGFGYDFDENIGVTLTYDRYSFKADGPGDLGRTAHANIVGINLEYRFW